MFHAFYETCEKHNTVKFRWSKLNVTQHHINDHKLEFLLHFPKNFSSQINNIESFVFS